MLPLLGRQLALINHSSQRRAAALQALLPFLSSAKSFLQKLQILVCTLINNGDHSHSIVAGGFDVIS